MIASEVMIMDQHKQELYEKGSKEGGSKLPPRSKTRQTKRKKKKEKYKLKYPLISALSLFFISLPVVAYFSYKHYASNQASFLMLDEKEETGYEVVDFAEPLDTDKKKDEPAGPVPGEINDRPSQPEGKEDESLKEPTRPAEGENVEKEEPSVSEGGRQIIQHTVQPNETLFSIAMQYYGDVKGTKIIREWNDLENGQIKQGQVLKIPVDVSETANQR
jgi:LysM repeat protein